MSERIVGKNALETLTTGMYKDSRIIFREYIQNSSDAIDNAINQGILKKENNRIDVKIDISKREIRIKDNGTGISNSEVYKNLGDIGVTTKDYKENRGFRGIGRLGGLGYCDELLFITSLKGEPIKTITKWDCKELRRLLKPNVAPDMSLIDVVNAVTNESSETENSESHYFEVILKGITKNNDKLLSIIEINDYLSQSAPVPFNYQNLTMLKAINENLSKRGKQPEEYNVFLNGEQIFKPYKRKVQAGKENEKDFIEDIIFFDSYNEDGSLFFLGWYAVTALSGSIKENDVNGIRVRKHNILIGDNYTLDPFFGNNPTYQVRNRWFIGEIYVYDENLLPNARRDDFEENETYFNFKSEVEKTTKELGRLPHEVSKGRNAQKEIVRAVNEIANIKNEINGGITSAGKERISDKISKIEENLKKVPSKKNDKPKASYIINKSKIQKAEEPSDKKDLILMELEKLKNEVSESKNYMADQVPSSYPKDVRKVVRKIFEVIDKELLELDAKRLQGKIIEELKK